MMLLENNSRIYVYEEGNWSIKGQFDKAVELDESIIWSNDGGEYTLMIGMVSFLRDIYLQKCGISLNI
jgi:hypothetical protein